MNMMPVQEQAHAAKGAARRILAVDDDPTALMYIEQGLINLGYQPTLAGSGAEALSMLRQDPSAVDIMILDRMMPEMDGIAVMREINRDPKLRNLPVIMLTGANDNNSMREGLDAGVFYYLAKPIESDLLKSVISAAVRQASSFQNLSAPAPNDPTGFRTLRSAKFEFRELEEAERLAGFLANCFPDPERVLIGLGALLINAVEHGICQIGYQAKGELLRNGTWREEVARRLALPEHAGLAASVVVTKKDDGTYVGVTDPGPGFNWIDYLTIDAARAADPHGRGIAQARATCFDALNFNEQGNQALGVVRAAEELDW